MLRFITTTDFAFQHSIAGIPKIGEDGSDAVAGFTMSFAPSTMTTSNESISRFTSSISFTTSYGMSASERITFMWPGSRPATGWIPNTTSTPRFVRAANISATPP